MGQMHRDHARKDQSVFERSMASDLTREWDRFAQGKRVKQKPVGPNFG
jgi:hypothetical protein